jgi:hypothetical protein
MICLCLCPSRSMCCLMQLMVMLDWQTSRACAGIGPSKGGRFERFLSVFALRKPADTKVTPNTSSEDASATYCCTMRSS